MTVPYDDFADIYDAWCDSAPITRVNQEFYVRQLVDATGPAVELGVGNGRICVAAAKRGKYVIGVDSSVEMLGLCEQRARDEGVIEAVELIQADFRDFRLSEPAALITIPFHTIGHLLTDDDKRAALLNIRGQLRADGRLILDHFVFDPDYPQEPGVPHLRAEIHDSAAGLDRLLWEATTRDMDRKLLRIIVWTEDLDARGNAVARRYRRSRLSWIAPQEMRSLLESCGFEILGAYGNFEGAPLDESSTHQVWVATPSERQLPSMP